MDGSAVLSPHRQAMLVQGTKAKEHAVPEVLKNSIAFVGIDTGKNLLRIIFRHPHRSGRQALVAISAAGERQDAIPDSEPIPLLVLKA